MIGIADASANRHGADTDLVLAFLPHPITDEVIADDDVLGRNRPDGAEDVPGLMAGVGRDEQVAAVRHLNEIPQTDVGVGVFGVADELE